MVIAGLICAPLIPPNKYDANITPRPHTIATCHTPLWASMSTAA